MLNFCENSGSNSRKMRRRERIILSHKKNATRSHQDAAKSSVALRACFSVLCLGFVWMMNGCNQEANLTEEQFIHRFVLYVDVPKSDYWNQVEKGMNRAFEVIQFKLDIKYSVQEDREAMNIALRSSVNSLRACAVALQNDEAAKKTILDTMQAGVPVVCVGNDLNRSSRIGAVLTNYYETGRKAGRYYAQQLRQGTVVLLGTMPVPSTREEVWEGMRHGIGYNRRLSLQTVKADHPAEIRLQLQQALINPKVSGVFLLGAETIESGLETIRNIGVNRPLIIGGLSHRRQHEELVRSGKCGLMIIEDPEEIGYRAGRFMRDVGTGRSNLNVQIFIPFRVYRAHQE
jgi:ABC-type sugar transport system substrate-binding protein